MVLDLRLSKDWDVEMTSFLFFTLFPTLFWTARSATGTPFGQWNALRAFGTIWNYLELPSAFWNRASGSTWNGLRAIGTREALLERPPGLGTREAPLERPQGSCGPCIVRWQEIISPSYYPLLERAKRNWNRLQPLDRPVA